MSCWYENFDWDDANEDHVAKHGFTPAEVEEALLDADQVSIDAYGVGGEGREAILGQTDAGAMLLVVFTMRRGAVRPISAREANAKQKRRYRG